MSALAPRELIRRTGKRTQSWLRDDRRLERLLHRVTRLESDSTLYSHELVIPMNSTYSPWYDDTDFRGVYDAIAGHTFVDQYKCYELWQLLGQLGDVDGDILEVGVWRGGTGALLATRAKSLSMDSSVYLADTFEGVANAGGEDPWYRGGEHADTSTDIVSDLASRLDVDATLLPGIFPDETGGAVDDRRFRFVHIDVDVYESAKRTFEWAWSRLSTGGVVVFDDYGSFECEGVATLGQELFATPPTNSRLLHNLNGHLVVIKLADDPVAG